MPHIVTTPARTALRWLFGAAFLAAVVVSGVFSGLMNTAGLFYLAAGSVAIALTGFSRIEISLAFRNAAGRSTDRREALRAAHFWQATARNVWILGVLGSTVSFTLALTSETGGITHLSSRMIQSLVVTLYGLVLAVVCLVPAMRLELRAGSMTGEFASETPRLAPPSVVTRAIGYILFAAVLGLTVAYLVRGYPQNGPLGIAQVVLHGPAILVVTGGAIAVALFVGPGAGAPSLTLGFGLTGCIGLLIGLIQALFGFAHASIAEIAAAIAFIVSSSSFALLGLVAIAGPLEDREVMEGRREAASPLSRMFWVLLPLVAFVFLVLAFIMVVTPMTVPG